MESPAASTGDAVKSLTPPRIPARVEANPYPPLDRTVKILALRVEFALDTLSTTSGDGGFAYDRGDPLYSSLPDDEVIYYDPPPHDSLYFADHLQFLRFYWDEMSTGSVDLEWDIFPAGERATYRLPKQMWQYNWNYTDAQLDRGLAELFRDAVTAADDDGNVDWQRYDLVMAFHAGAGAEFDIGYTTTPHDIPSAWMVAEDFRVIGYEDGIPVDDGAYRVRGGLILPETETHEGVQIGMAGVICSLFGHWLGLPALYDRDDGDPVVGKWSLMDRGFGNYFGAIPGPVDAWSRIYMGWLEAATAVPDSYNVAARRFATAEAPEAVKIPISGDEYFLIENRARDPELDAVAVAYDRDGRRLVFTERYDSLIVEPGFRVPVRIDNLDFDSPGSGILIWHVDEALLPLADEGRFNSVDELRGLDLEEADGAQDIGRSYPFLTPGWGTDYGIYTDPWYADNDHHKSANGGRLVSFNDYSYPDSRANSGAYTHTTVNNFDRRGTVMGFRYGQTGLYLQQPVRHQLHTSGSIQVAVGSFDGNPNDQEFALFGDGSVNLYDGDGSLLHQIAVDSAYSHQYASEPIIRDLNGDERDEILWNAIGGGGREYLHILESTLFGNYSHRIIDSQLVYDSQLAAGGSGMESTILLAASRQIDFENIIRIKEYNSALELLSEMTTGGSLKSLHRFGSAQSDTFLIVAESGEVFFWHRAELRSIGLIAGDRDGISILNTPVLVDVDGSGEQDLIVRYQYVLAGYVSIVHDPYTKGVGQVEKYTPREGFHNLEQFPVPVDVDLDGQYELAGWGVNGSITAVEYHGLIVDNFPWRSRVDLLYNYIFAVADLDGNEEWEYIYTNTLPTQIREGEISDFHYSKLIEVKTTNDVNYPGFPAAPRIDYWRSRICQLDDEPGLELLMVSDDAFDIIDLGAGGARSSVWWGQPYRDSDHSNAVWESATPFSAAPSSPIMPADQCYNWPNPAQGSTAIRYFLNFSASVKVDVFDVMGERVTTLSGPGAAGLPNEIMWDLTGVARGGYVAVVEAVSGARKETRLVKIAVVK